MDLKLFTSSSEPKPWLNIYANSMNAAEMKCDNGEAENFIINNLTANNLTLGANADIECDGLLVNTNATISGNAYPTDQGGANNILTTDGNGTLFWAPLPTGQTVDSVIWRAGAPTSGNVVGTWAEVQNLILATQGALTVYVDDSLNPCVIDSSTDCLQRVIFKAGRQDAGLSVILKIGTDIHLLNPAGFYGPMIINFDAQISPAIMLYTGGIIFFTQGTQLNPVGSLIAPIQVMDGETMIVGLSDGTAVASGPLINVGVGSTCILTVTNTSGATFGSLDVVTSTDPSGNLVYGRDASGPDLTNFGFVGTVASFLTENAKAINYNDSIPFLGAATVQTAIDALKSSYGGFHMIDFTHSTIFPQALIGLFTDLGGPSAFTTSMVNGYTQVMPYFIRNTGTKTLSAFVTVTVSVILFGAGLPEQCQFAIAVNGAVQPTSVTTAKVEDDTNAPTTVSFSCLLTHPVNQGVNIKATNLDSLRDIICLNASINLLSFQ